MSIIVEDGTGKADAESFCTVIYADAYHLARGNTAWAALATEAKEQALRNATDYMLQMFRARWQGYRVTDTQSLDWPRYNVIVDGYYVDSDIVPDIVQRACAEFALRASSGVLWADETQAVASEAVGSISVTYRVGSPQRTRYPAIEALLAPYLRAGGGVSIGIVR